MKLHPLFLAAPMLLASSPAWSQPITLEELARRVEALEQENASLRQEVERLSGARGAAGASPPETVATMPAAVHADAPPPPDADPWEGAYFGLSGGLTEARYDYRSLDTTPSKNVTASGAAFGAQLGVRWQHGPLVTGLELQFSRPQDQSALLPVGSGSIPLDMGMSGRIAGQVGIAVGPVLAYGTAGLQLQRTRLGITGGPAAGSFRNGTATGFSYGIGVEARLTDRISIGIEGVKADFGLIPGTNTITGRSRGVAVRLNHRLP